MATALVFVLAWSLCGLAIAVLAGRRGHNLWLFAAMGLAYGPLTIVLVWVTSRGRGHVPAFIAEGEPWHADGWLEVLIGLDGTEAAIEAVEPMLEKFGPAIRALHLASVVDHEITDSPDAFEADDERLAYLADAAERFGVPGATEVLLGGKADVELTSYAEAHDIDVIVIGHRTRPLNRALRGSTLTGMARHSEVPILVLPSA